MTSKSTAPTPLTGAPNARFRRRVRSLDGLQGVAVLAVMLFHTASSPLGGGFLGVDVFFTLSGFLIAGILVRQWDQSGKILLAAFWLRRARRLAPALLLLLAALAMARLAIPQLQSSLWRMDILAALTYTTNWFQIVSGGDYFAQFGVRSPARAHVVAGHRGAVLHSLRNSDLCAGPEALSNTTCDGSRHPGVHVSRLDVMVGSDDPTPGPTTGLGSRSSCLSE